MAYQALYRRYRSRRFSELRGQAHVVSALRNAVRDGRVSHAYLFSGPRGTGKTSTARIMAKALNCEHLVDGEPCCECDSCLAIEQGTSYDLQELDAASNNGVDAMRDLIGKAALGSPGRTKVYILDEVHMLSTAASNALLKTLEEPPPHVVFVLATTDPEKVLRTIRSRTQHLEFHLLPADELANHVRWIASDAGLDVSDDIVDFVLRKGGGSARDTLSALDQVVAAGGVLDSTEGVDELVGAICASDTGAALKAVDGAVKVGRDPRVLGEALLAKLRDVFLQRMGVTLDHLPDADRALVMGWAEQLGDRAVTRALEAVGEALLEMRQAPDPRIPLEVALVRITRSDTDVSLDGVLARLERLERSIAEGEVGSGAGPVGAPPAGSATVEAPPPAPSPRRVRPLDAARAALPGGGNAAAPPARPAPTGSDAPPAPPAGRATSGSASGAPPAPSGGSSGAPPAPSGGSSGAPPAPSAPAGPSAGAGATEPPAPAVGPAATAAAAPAPNAASGSVPARDELTLAWGDTVLPNLRGLAKAMYAVGRFLDTEGAHAVFALPNEAHRAKCAEKQPDVEAALAKHFGRPVPLRLVVDQGAVPPPGSGSGTPGASDDGPFGPGPAPAAGGEREGRTDPAAPTESADPAEFDVDLSELTDAPADDRTPIDRLTEVFPGAQVVDGE